ncbi:histidine kinase [Smaragdicoccus niigatensis]|uniref:sensor histidine kinase n=1 Tax=Smaragdicoccus niigatensis TaxID=359359 RepID=UPI000378BB5A|nr:histidine kinase [Smaragdicoccus niigatensis]
MSADTPTLDTPKRGFPERFYARFGWKVWPIASAIPWASGLAMTIAGAWNTQRVRAAPVDEYIGLCLWITFTLSIGALLSVVAAIRGCRSLRTLPSNGSEAATAWNTTVALPGRLIKRGVAVIVVWALPCIAIGFFAVYGYDLPMMLWFAFGGLIIPATTLTALAYGVPLLLRAVLADLEPRLDGRTPAAQSLSLRTRLLLFIPVFSVGTASGAAEWAQPAGAGIDSDTVYSILLTACFAFVFWTPVAVLFAHSLLTPLSDLRAATGRIKKADYTRPVPLVWADELGAVAGSLNDAMGALSERQQMAREVRESRARIVAAADRSRKRIERNIHDGAQQRLVAMALDVRMLQQTAPTMSTDEINAALEQFAESLKESLAELRDLARGLHPAILSTDGLAPALQQLATRAKVPISVTAPPDRFPEQIETTAYFVAAEALANVAKYARASRATVTAAQEDGRLSIEIADDGVGGASATSGSGLSGLVDRVAAIGGRLTVDSEIGRGTRIVADLPVNGWASSG